MLIVLALIFAVLFLSIGVIIFIKKLPAHLRNMVQRIAAVLFILAIFRALFHEHIMLMSFKTYALIHIFSQVMSIAFAFMLLLLSFQTIGFERSEKRVKLALIKNIRCFNQFDKDAILTSSFLQSSPIMLQ